MAFKLEIGKSFAREIPRIARERIKRVIVSLSQKPHPDAECIHSARKDLKSLRALLRLARGSVTDETRQKENLLFRDIGRSLSPLRDSHALVEALKKFPKGGPRANSKNSAIDRQMRLDFIHRVRDRIEQEAVKELPEGTVTHLKMNLRGALRRVALWLNGSGFEANDEWEPFVGQGLRRTYRQAKDIVGQMENLGIQNAGDETWHELRKCGKALEYQLRLLRPVWPELLGTLLEGVDRLNEKLGDDHDLAVLRNRMLTEPYGASEMQEAAEIRRSLIDSLDRRRRKLQAEAYQLARLIYAEKPKQFANRIRSYWSISQAQPTKTPTPAARRSPDSAPKKHPPPTSATAG